MTVARRNLVDPDTPGFYHCTNRCVRRTFLCGFDELTGIDYSHRKDKFEKRMLELCNIFSVEIFAFAVMSNHFHIVLYTDPMAPQKWTDEEIAERWLCAYPGRLDLPKFAQQREMKKQAIINDPEKLKLYRKRLGELSWYMARLNESIAKSSNIEDGCTGKFWESRYSSQALLDEAAVFSCMAYVDLNPVRAKVTEKLSESHNTSIKKRLDDLKEPKSERTLNEQLNSIAGNIRKRRLTMSIKSYIELVEYTGKSIIHPNKASIPPHITSTLYELNLQPNHWLKQIEDYGKNYVHVVGPIEAIRAKAKQMKVRSLHGITAAKLLYATPN